MNVNDKDKEQLEKEFSQALTDGEMEQIDPEKEAADRLSPRYEIRIQAKMDPIVEETRLYRQMAKEVGDRYDRYLARIPHSTEETSDGEE